MRVTIKILKKAFASCEQTYNNCWTTLDGMKNLESEDKDQAHNVIMFQENLATALFNLQKLRNAITAEKKRLIICKEKYNKNWFSNVMQRLSIYTKGIDHATNMGKALGDAFAFFFYLENLDLLKRHHEHPKISNFVSGAGGNGEMIFLKNCKIHNGKFTLYHGITNILRFGDFSFVDLQTHEITEIGELKTKKTGDENHYELSLTLVGTKIIKKPKKEVSEFKVDQKLDQRAGDKLKRQIDAIVNIVKSKKEDDKYSKNVDGLFYFSELQKLYEQATYAKPAILKVSSGLLFAAISLPRASLFKKIFSRKAERLIKSLSDELIKQIPKLIKQGSHNNNIIMGQLLYNPDYTDKNTPGTIPLFWYPFKSILIKDLYFSQFMVISTFNPVYLIEELQENEYHVSSKYLLPESQKNREKFRKGIQYFDLFISYIINYLQSEKSIIDSIKQAEKIVDVGGEYTAAYISPQFIFESLFEIQLKK